MRKLYVLGGGTISHIRNHLALCAPAFGSTARAIFDMCVNEFPDMEKYLRLTKMADFTSNMITNDDVEVLVDQLKEDHDVKVIFFNVALCDWKGEIAVNIEDDKDVRIPSGKYAERLKTKEGYKMMMLTPANKIIAGIRETRPDIFVVGFKTTCGATPEDQFNQGKGLIINGNASLVLANDTRTRLNMILDFHGQRTATKDRTEALRGLVYTVRERTL